MDFSNIKKISIEAGDVKQIEVNGVVVWKSGYTNLVPKSIDTDGTILNGTGYANGYRVRSSGALGEISGAVATGYIPVSPGDVIRFSGVTFNNAQVYECILFAGEGFSVLGSFTTQPARYGFFEQSKLYDIDVTESNGVYSYTVPNYSGIKWFRMSAAGSGENMIVTVNEEID